MQRACAAALLTGGETIIRNPGHSNDDQAALGVIKGLGARVELIDNDALKIISHGVNPLSESLDCGESGLGIRMFTPIMALSDKRILITGRGSLLNRPMDFFDAVLPKLGVQIHSNNGRLPVSIQGPLQPADIDIDGSLSSQFLTGLLMAFASAASVPVTIRVNNLKSRPYIDLTLKVMQEFAMQVPENDQYESFHFSGNRPIAAAKRRYSVEGDWSGAAFLLVSGAVAGEIFVQGLDLNSTQADRAVLSALEYAGAIMTLQEDQIRVAEPAGNGLRAFEFDATDCPDLFPPLVALAAYCKGQTRIRGVHRLTHKESNRAQTLMEEFGKMGTGILLQDDLMVIQGASPVRGAAVHSRHDHRIAMACAVAAIRAEGKTSIDEAQAIDKSYPDFFDDLKTAGASVQVQYSTLNVQ